MIRRKKNGWQADVRVGKGKRSKRIRRSFSVKAEAQQWVLRMKSQLEFSPQEMLDSSSRTITDLIEHYYLTDSYGTLSKGSKRRYQEIYRRFERWCKECDIVLAKHFTYEDAQRYARYIRGVSKGRGQEAHLTQASKVFRFELMRDNPSIRRNPFQSIVKSSKRPMEMPRFFSAEEHKAVREHMDDLQKAIFELLYFTAMRSGELHNLPWVHVIGNESIHIRSFREWVPKTPESARPIPLVKSLSGCLDHLRSVREDEFVIPRSMAEKSNFYRLLWKEVVRKTVQTYPHLTSLWDTTPHTMRKSCASHMLQRGIGIYTVSKFLRHTTIETTIRYYGALLDDNLRSAAESLG